LFEGFQESDTSMGMLLKYSKEVMFFSVRFWAEEKVE
jgi:hypothetical protein